MPCLILIAFFLQSYVTQTHIHDDWMPAAPLVAYSQQVGAPSPVPGPDDKSPATCPLCQAIMYAGVFVAPVGQLLLPPAPVWGETVPVGKAMAAVFSTHGWQSRAPPRR